MRYIDKTTRPLSQHSHTVSTTKTQKIERERERYSVVKTSNINTDTHTYIHYIHTTNKFIMMCVFTYHIDKIDKRTQEVELFCLSNTCHYEFVRCVFLHYIYINVYVCMTRCLHHRGSFSLSLYLLSFSSRYCV